MYLLHPYVETLMPTESIEIVRDGRRIGTAAADDLRIKAELKRGSGRTGPTLHSWKATYSLAATAAED
tara:strand:- start:9337 stop:9540 length:204 start_codon:yes stop_codon:yes gene_type:complete